MIFFRIICILLMSKSMTNSATAIFNGAENEEAVEDYGTVSNRLHNVYIAPGNTYRSSTTAGVHYEQILTSISMIMENATIICTEANVMPFSVMWSGAQQETKANAIAEMVFRGLKQRLCISRAKYGWFQE